MLLANPHISIPFHQTKQTLNTRKSQQPATKTLVMATKAATNNTSAAKSTSDPLKERKEFDDTKAGVKGLVDSGITSIPSFFIHPPHSLSDLAIKHHDDSIPTIDLSGVDSGSLRRVKVVEEVSQACREFGFFQVVNHGIPQDLIDRMIVAVKRFHEQPLEEKAKWYRRDPSTGVAFSSNFDLFFTKAASWRDTLQLRLAPVFPELENIPEVIRNEMIEWTEQIQKLAEILMELLCEGLGVDSGRFKELTFLDAMATVCHYYPYCPQPNLTLGSVSHKDPGVLTLLLQDDVGGLQVKKDAKWIDVKPIPGALVINVGDILQIISNGEYKSVDHRVLANSSKEPRVSVASFYNPSDRDRLYGPLPELLTPEKPALYKQFNVGEFLHKFFKKELGDKTLVEHYMLPAEE